MMPYLALSALCGSVLGFGLWLAGIGHPAARRARFVDRIGPQLRAVEAPSRLLGRGRSGVSTLAGPLGHILRSALYDLAGWFVRFSPASRALALRLDQSGAGQSVMEFRARQIVTGAVGFCVSTVLMVLWGVSGGGSVVAALAIVLGSAVGSGAVLEMRLRSRIRRREARMLAEFPSIAELMALAVSAGESATGALERICRTSHGELAKEFGELLADTRAGMPLIDALQAFSDRNRLAPLVRFVDGLTVAVQRGTPLADVLRAQAQDVRDLSKRELMESAGKKEIAMMIPVVFGVLPLTVLFAVFPGLALIQLGF